MKNKKNQLAQVMTLWKRYGTRDLICKKIERSRRDSLDFQLWYEKHVRRTPEKIRQQQNTEFEYQPLISIVVPTYETNETHLRAMIDSVIAQTYQNWQLCLADGSESSKVEKFVEIQYPDEKRITYRHLEENRGIAENTNAGLEMAEGDMIALLDHDDLLSCDALFEVVKAQNEHPKAQVFYSDEDKIIDESQRHVQPHFKPDLNWFLLRSNNYICHFFVADAKIVREIGGFQSEFDGAQDYDFILRCVEKAQEVYHIAKILYHWRIHAGSTAGNTASKLYAYDAGKRAIEAHLQRQGIAADVTMTKDLGFYRTSYRVKGNPKIECMSTQEAYERLGMGQIDKKEDVDYYVIVSDQISMRGKRWKQDLVAACQQSGVGMAGGRVYDRFGKLSHAAFTISENNKIVPILKGLPRGFKGDFARAVTCQNVSFVGGDVFCVSARALREIGGFSKDFKGNYAAVDLGLRMEEAGYAVVYQPSVVGILKKREEKRTGQEEKQQSAFIRKWELRLKQKDPYYNPNLGTMPADYRPKGITICNLR